MKVSASVKKRSADCKIVRRKGTLYVINKKNPITGGEHALRLTHIIDHMERSLKIEEPCTIVY